MKTKKCTCGSMMDGRETVMPGGTHLMTRYLCPNCLARPSEIRPNPNMPVKPSAPEQRKDYTPRPDVDEGKRPMRRRPGFKLEEDYV